MSTLSKIIAYFADHDVSQPLRRRVWQRLAAGPLDDDTEAELRHVWKELEGTAQMDDASLRQAYRHVREKTSATTRRSARRTRWLLHAAVWVIPVLILGAAAWLYLQAVHQERQLSQVSLIQVFTAKGETRHVVLPDSSEVWVNGGSALVYPSVFLSDRCVTLMGEAYFKVRHHEEKPFLVSINQLTLRDLGTTFNVSSFPDTPRTLVTLESGALSVDAPKRSYLLKPDEQLSYSTRTGAVTVRNVAASDYTSWRNGIVCVNDEDFRAVLRQLEQTYGVTFHVQTARYDNQRVRMHFDRHESLSKILSVFAALVPGMKYEMDGNDVYIR